jgi:hypothetical protein
MKVACMKPRRRIENPRSGLHGRTFCFDAPLISNDAQLTIPPQKVMMSENGEFYHWKDERISVWIRPL